jgi:hypothetical protein
MEKQVITIRGVAPWELEEYFIAIGGNLSDKGRYAGEGWEVELIKGFSNIGPISIYETQIIFYWDRADLKGMADKFRLKFMRAGG